MILLLANVFAFCMTTAWLWSAFGLYLVKGTRFSAPPAFRTVFHELKPLYRPAIAVWVVTEALTDGVGGWDIFIAVGYLLSWYLYKDVGGDDDRWKRRRERLAERVSVMGSRLAVVPTGGGS